ncbi:MAG: multiheme c-type cytochrome [Alphaproteobacteria bacterium]|nr:multiheme c-type cytochrome [Alphaproteobacteria bacterium]
MAFGLAARLAADAGSAASAAADFVGRETCVACHKAQGEAWSGSHHDWAMREASEDTVLGDFDDARFTHAGVTSRFFRKDGKYVVNTDGADGRLADFEIVYTFGISPLQQYLIAQPGGRLQALTIAWDTERKRWFHLLPDAEIAAGDPRHWTGRLHNWNGRCGECHTTGYRKRYDLESESYATSWAEINVSCEACHGPGARHVAWARAGEKTEDADTGLVVGFKEDAPGREIEACARCHARRAPITQHYEHGAPFLDHFRPALLRQELYFPDGQIQDEVYVYGSFLQSKMQRAGVRCTDCHDPHTARVKADGDALCVRCHGQAPDARFESLPRKAYDTPAHHHHPAGSPGAQCVNCHMPARSYMVVDPRRDHSFRIPRPDLSARLETPDACTGCHADKPADWAADAIVAWTGGVARRGAHFGDAIAAGRDGQAGAEAKLVALAEDPAQSAIARATALQLLRPTSRRSLAPVVEALKSDDPLLRLGALAAIEALPPVRRPAYAAPLLDDPVRAVRLEAARVLAPVPTTRLEAPRRQAFEDALAEYEAAQEAMADQPEAHLNLGVLYMNRGRPDLAERANKTALRLAPGLVPAYVTLAHLYNQTGRNTEAEAMLRAALENAPDDGRLYYSLGLLLGEMQRYDDAAEALGAAARRLPYQPRVRYNHALVLQHLGRRKEAEAELLAAHRLEERDPRILEALALFYLGDGKYAQAKSYADRLVRLFPNSRRARLLQRRIQLGADEQAR